MRQTDNSISSTSEGLALAPDSSQWASFHEHWILSMTAAALRPATITAYKASLKMFAEWCLTRGIGDPTHVTKLDLELYFDHRLTRTTRRGGKHSPRSVHREYRNLRVFYNWLVSEEEIERSPMAAVRPPKVTPAPVQKFDDDSLSALVAACSGGGFPERRDRAMIRLLFDSGVRRAELIGLRMSDLELRKRLVLVEGKGGRKRLVPLGLKATQALLAYLRARERHPDAGREELWLAAAPHKGALGYDGIPQMLRRRARQAGVDEKMFAHRFRHTAVSAFLRAGGSEGDAMKIFGWSDGSASMVRHYSAADAAERARERYKELSPGDRI